MIKVTVVCWCLSVLVMTRLIFSLQPQWTMVTRMSARTSRHSHVRCHLSLLFINCKSILSQLVMSLLRPLYVSRLSVL